MVVMRCLLVCEGGFDTVLLPHIGRLIARYSHSKPEFETSTSGRRLVDKISNSPQRIAQYDLLFVHRDADNARADERYREIAGAVEASGYAGPWVGIVPVRMTESWLLLDEAAIRRAVRNPNGRTQLILPSPHEAERRASPRAILETALLDASEKRGRRRTEMQRALPGICQQLLQNLPVGGPLERVPSWVRFRDDTVAALQAFGG